MRDPLNAQRRIILLQALQLSDDGSESNEMLQRALKARGHIAGVADVDAQLDWLEQRDLLQVRAIGAGIRVARITRAGLDAARGDAHVPGVDWPDP